MYISKIRINALLFLLWIRFSINLINFKYLKEILEKHSFQKILKFIDNHVPSVPSPQPSNFSNPFFRTLLVIQYSLLLNAILITFNVSKLKNLLYLCIKYWMKLLIQLFLFYFQIILTFMPEFNISELLKYPASVFLYF